MAVLRGGTPAQSHLRAAQVERYDGQGIGELSGLGFLMPQRVDLDRVRRSYLRNTLASRHEGEKTKLEEIDVQFLADETRWSPERVRGKIAGDTGAPPGAA